VSLAKFFIFDQMRYTPRVFRLVNRGVRRYDRDWHEPRRAAIAEPLTVAALVARLPEDAPRFVLLRHRHSRDDGDRDANGAVLPPPNR